MNINWMPRKSHLLASYLVGFLACWGTCVLVLAQRGPNVYANPLFALLYLFLDVSRSFFEAGPIPGAPVRDLLLAPSVLLASGLVAIFFPACLSLFLSQRKATRIVGIILFLVLLAFTFAWGKFPPVI